MTGNILKKRIVPAVVFLLAVLMVFAALPYRYFELNAVDVSKSNEDALKAKLETLQNEQADLKAKLDNTKNDLASQESKKKYLDSLVLATQNEIDTANELIVEYTAMIDQKVIEIAAAEEDIQEKYATLLDRLRFIYEEGNASYLEMLLDAEDMPNFLMTVERVGSMLDFDSNLMSELSAQLQLLNDEKKSMADTKAAQEELRVSLIDKEAQLEQQKKDTENYITELQADEEAYQAQYEAAKAAEEKANSEIEALLAARAAQSSAVFSGGTFFWPTPVQYKTVSSPYGWRILWGRSDFHLGIDIPVPYGTSICASRDGTVVTATWHYSYGYYVLIDHGDGSATLYAHNSQLLVSAGDTVSQGEVIAKAGSTGISSGSHCHFEVRIGGKTQNPLNYVSAP